MIRKYLIPILAVAGLSFAIWKVSQGSKPAPVAKPVVPPAAAPFAKFVAGAGLIEANTENIAVAASMSGIIAEIHVRVGDRVESGAPLFKMDDRAAQAELRTARAAVEVSKANVDEAVSALGTATKLFNLANNLSDKRAISVEEMSRRTSNVTVAEARLAAAKAAVIQAEARVAEIETNIELRTVRAPANGEVLQIRIRPGEFAVTGRSEPLLVLGGTEPLHIRVDVDETDAWRIRNGAAAVGFLRGNNQIKMPLQFVRFEPYVIPKKSLTGDSTERVDTRVLQILFRFDRGELPVYIGQQVDVFIEAGS